MRGEDLVGSHIGYRSRNGAALVKVLTAVGDCSRSLCGDNRYRREGTSGLPNANFRTYAGRQTLH